MDFGIFDTLNLLGSLGLFLVGMKIMSDALMELAGNRMRRIMADLTSNRFKGVLTGLFITGLIQSSSSTTLMVVSFVNAGLLKLTEALSVIMGANIGTTLTAWLITVLGFKMSMSDIALPLMILGFLFSMRDDPQLKRFGSFIVGFALLFIGLDFMKNGVPDLQSSPQLFEFIQAATNFGAWSLLLFLLLGTLLTLILQSSSATMAITLVAVSQNWLPFEAACAIVLGENLGTTITANMAAFVANTNARRAALSHTVFNVIGVIWVLALFTPFIGMIRDLVTGLFGTAGPEGAIDPTIGLAVFHTTFNILNTLLLIGFIGPIANLVRRLIPETTQPQAAMDQAIYLEPDLLKYPQTAIQAMLRETRRMYSESVTEIILHAVNLHRHDIEGARSLPDLVAGSRAIISMNFERFVEQRIRPVYNDIIAYGTQVHQRLSLANREEEQLQRINYAARDALLIIGRAQQLNTEINAHMETSNSAVRETIDVLRVSVVEFTDKIKALSPEGTRERLDAELDELSRWSKTREKSILRSTGKAVMEDHISPEVSASIYASARLFRSMCRDIIRVMRHLSSADERYSDAELELKDLPE